MKITLTLWAIVAIAALVAAIWIKLAPWMAVVAVVAFACMHLNIYLRGKHEAPNTSIDSLPGEED